MYRTLARRYLNTVNIKAASPATVALFDQLHRQRDRYALARAITLVESTRDDHRLQAQHLLSMVLAAARNESTSQSAHLLRDGQVPAAPLRPSFRIGLSGSPGVGKSTFIEVFGMELIRRGHRVAVLAVDPSSSMTGGSILGDKTRMVDLSRHDQAYVRPSPSRGTLGGVARNTGEAILLCESAGYDVILVETVGVGQSETMVADMVDMFALLVPPGGGDELQGIKKGIVELADIIIINKADGELKIPAQMTQIEYVSALKLLRPRYELWKPEVLKVSAVEKKGIVETWTSMADFYTKMMTTSELDKKRSRQSKKWMWRIITEDLIGKLRTDSKVQELVVSLEQKVLKGELTPGKAADKILHQFLE